MLFRLFKKAATYTTARFPYGNSINPYLNADNPIEDLQALFEDSIMIKNYKHVYFDLVMGLCKFSNFYIDFGHFSSLLSINQDALIYNLKQKVVS